MFEDDKPKGTRLGSLSYPVDQNLPCPLLAGVSQLFLTASWALSMRQDDKPKEHVLVPSPIQWIRTCTALYSLASAVPDCIMGTVHV